MAWARFDDQFNAHPKVLAAGPLATALHMRAIIYCAQYLTDGHVGWYALDAIMNWGADAEHVDMERANNRALAKRLVEAGLWEVSEAGWLIHDYLEYNPAASEVGERRAKRSEAGRLGGKRSAEARARQAGNEDEASAQASAQANAQASASPNAKQTASKRSSKEPSKNEAKSNPVPVPVPVPLKPKTKTTDQTRALAVTDASAPQAGLVLAGEVVNGIDAQVAEVWGTYAGIFPKRKLNPKRKALIRRQLKAGHDVSELQAAIRGAASDAWLVERRYTSLELYLRDTEHIERYASYWEHGPPRRGKEETAREQDMRHAVEELRGEAPPSALFGPLPPGGNDGSNTVGPGDTP